MRPLTWPPLTTSAGVQFPAMIFPSPRTAIVFYSQGVGNGHGIGLCQAGAKAMAESGAGFREILEHYYPNTEIVKHSGRNRLK